MHSFAPRTTARRGTPGSRTATNSRAGCSEPAAYWSLASNLFTSHWGHRVNKHPTGCPTRRLTEEQWNSLRFETKRDGQNLCLDCYVYTVKNSKHGVVTWRCVSRDHPVQCPPMSTTSSMQPALLHPFPKCRPKRPLFTQLQSVTSVAETSGPKRSLAETSVHRVEYGPESSVSSRVEY